MVLLAYVEANRVHTAADTVSRSSALAGAYAVVAQGLVVEGSLEHRYRLGPDATGACLLRTARRGGPGRPGRHREHRPGGGEAVAPRVPDLRRRGPPGPRTPSTPARRLPDRAGVKAAFEATRVLVDTGVARTDKAAAAANTELRRVLLLLYVMIGIGVCVAVAMGLIVRRYHRRLVRQAEDTRHLSLHDALTGLPNRALFTDRVGQRWPATRRHGTSLAVLLIDLDRFKEVNETLGHDHGDRLLREVATRLVRNFRAGDTVARLAGDEFAVLLPDATEKVATDLARRALKSLEQSFALGDVTIDVETSIGLAMAPAHAATVEELMRSVDLALWSAKDRKTGVVTYEPPRRCPRRTGCCCSVSCAAPWSSATS
jgi:diguanylate cyclase (GGDEF)-like protein